MKFGDYIRGLRERERLNQPEAAAKVSIEQSYLSKLETGKSYPSEDIFNRLVKAYKIDTAEMSKQLFSGELDKLREIKEVRKVVLERQKSELVLVRGWLVTGLILLMLGAAGLATAIIPESAEPEFYYRSNGVILAGEALTTFDIVEGEQNVITSFSAEQQGIMDRIKQDYKVTTVFKGEAFIENVENGKRYYQLYDSREMLNNSPRRWFLIPGLMFIFGSFGSFFLSYRWK
jgi:transcriptional regulator with XRE-family HTH domain